MGGTPTKAPNGASPSREQRARRLSPSGRCFKFLFFLLLCPLALLLSAGRAEAGTGGGGSSNTTYTDSTTTSGTTTVIVPGGGPLANALQQALAGPNGAVVGNALAQVLSGSAVSQTIVNSSTTIIQTIGPKTIPVGIQPVAANGIRSINCNGPPNGLPAPNCNYSGYQQLVVQAGDTNFNTNTNFDVNTHVTLTGGNVGMISGDLYTNFQITILDGDFRFVDTLLGRGMQAGPGVNLLSPRRLGFAPDDERITTPQIDQALGYASAPMVGKAPATAPLGGGWSAWVKGDAGNAKFAGDASNFGFGYRAVSGEGGIEYAIGPWLMGAAAGFGQANVTQDVSNDFGSISTLQVGAYGAYRPGPYVLSVAMTYANSTIDATRLAMLPTPSTASYGANSFGTGVQLSTTRPFYGGTVEPMVGLIYNQLWTNGFTETGDPGLDITGNAASVATLKGYVGARAFTAFEINGTQVIPELRARVLYDFLNNPSGFTASFAADPTLTQFPVTGIVPDRVSEMLGGTVNVRLTPRSLAFVSYDAELRGGDVAQFFSGGFKVRW